MICNATESNASDKFLKKMSTKMSVLAIDPVYHRYVHRYSLKPVPNFQLISKKSPPFHIISTQTPINGATTSSRDFRAPEAVVETSESSKTTFNETFELERTEKVEGKIITKFERGKNDEHWWLTVGCSIPGTWILHWGVNYAADVGWEWDQPPLDMRPPGSIAIKDYAIETPFKRKSASVEGEEFYEVVIEFNTKSSIAAINFVLKDDETGNWYQHRGRDFKLSLIEYLQDDGNVVGAKKDSSIWPGGFGQLSEIFIKPEASESKVDIEELSLQKKPLEGFYEEHSVVKVTAFHNSVSVSVKHFHEQAKNVLHVETDLPGDVVVHWGVCRDENKNWEIPSKPYPPQTTLFKNKALRTLLKQKNDGNGSWGSFSLADERFLAFPFVLKLDNTTWINYKGNDFYIPFSCPIVPEKRNSESCDGILKGIRSLASDISSEKSRKTQSKEAHRSILHEIERLAAEAYSIFRSSLPTFLSETEMPENESSVKISSGTGSGFEILCQGFNWESHKSGKWYMELHEKAPKLAELGFTVIWLPPPTDSVSPEGYMPRDLYNLNSRYGNMDQLKNLVKRLHEVNIRVLGDVVLNHRCAQHRNQNGIWNIFGGRLNWDDRAVVSDDPHFQGRGNKSSGDNFHAAPNIDHSQEFVRKDIREWLCWLRDEIGYDGWRLDFARGFWGGYVKDYLDSSEPYFAVGEFWDSLSYRYGEMEHDQDAHRQRIVDWINATNGTAGAFDVTTKGILHSALERCEYWRLSDNKEKPPGVLGWWPSRAVTFIENHDTGSTQGHWRFPSGKEMQGYAYILTHAGTPSVFYDHIFSEYQSEISALISIRKKNKIHCRSKVQIIKAEGDVYAALIDENLTMKIGPGHFEPSNDARNWSLAIEGEDYKVWQAS